MSKLLNFSKNIAFASLLKFGMLSSVFACSITGLQHEIKFSIDESTLGKKEAVALAIWFVHQRDVRSHDEIDIVSIYPKNNRKFAELSQDRIQNISKIINTMNIERIPLVLYSGESKQAQAELEGSVCHEVLVIMSPSCTRPRNCCGISVN